MLHKKIIRLSANIFDNELDLYPMFAEFHRAGCKNVVWIVFMWICYSATLVSFHNYYQTIVVISSLKNVIL